MEGGVNFALTLFPVEATGAVRPSHDRIKHGAARVRVDFDESDGIPPKVEIVAEKDSLCASGVMPDYLRRTVKNVVSIGR
jgi:hypothetical protein